MITILIRVLLFYVPYFIELFMKIVFFPLFAVYLNILVHINLCIFKRFYCTFDRLSTRINPLHHLQLMTKENPLYKVIMKI